MSEKARFVLAYQDDLYAMTELCERFQISRKTGYKWLARAQEVGLDGLKEQSRKPRTSPCRLSEAVAHTLLEARRLHPTWGSRKLLPWLAKTQPELAAACSTSDTALNSRLPVGSVGATFIGASRPNSLARRSVIFRPTLTGHPSFT